MELNTRRAVDTIWNYLRIGDDPTAAECLLVLGSRDDRVATYAADLANAYSYDTIVISGGIAHHNDLLATSWSEATEAEHFYAVMRSAGLKQSVVLEDHATNTGDNAQLSYRLLAEHGITARSILVVTKPYMERRAKATFEMQWPDEHASILVSSPPCTFETYCNHDQPAEDVINIMVGDLERIMQYPRLGFQTRQSVPSEVRDALSVLKSRGYTKHSLG